MAQHTKTSILHTLLNWLGHGPMMSKQEIANQDQHRNIWLNNRAPITWSKADHYSY